MHSARRCFTLKFKTTLVEQSAQSKIFQKSLLMEKRISSMINRQMRLRDDLRSAKRLLGVADEHFLHASTSNLQGATLLEALTQVCEAIAVALHY
ncbi:unnamed protein product [Gongylonema pulchrum]|uniref:Endosome-associated-trafficking regulator 1 n=1 Tax=Gongylonema pulchrum TaxID=637853 RepID=A0A183DLR5_9BILA|nr:unnamed protein product [Gongylonema pulchrum]